MSSILDTLKAILNDILGAFKKEALDVETFFVAAAKYAAANIKPELLKIVADCMTAAEQAFTADPTVDKYTFALSNIVAALEKDAIAFAESDINYAVEAVIQQRNARI